MQSRLLLLLSIFVINLSYNTVQAFYCYNCTACASSSGNIYPGCTVCAIASYSNKIDKTCASLCIPGSYQGGYLYCCYADYCNYNTTLYPSISCYNCPTCTSSSPGDISSGCASCATIVYPTYTEKFCASKCIPGSYQGGYLYCCTTNNCNYNTPFDPSLVSCYQCSNCSPSSPGSLTDGCAACATTVYSNYIQKECVKSCSSGSYQGGYRYCCNSNYCNYDTPGIACYSCLLCSKPFQITDAKIKSGCTSCATIDYPSYTQKYCASSSCTQYTNNNYGSLSCCDSNFCNNQ